MIVKVMGAGVKLAGKWRFKGETAEINKEEYERNKDFVEIMEEDRKQVLKANSNMKKEGK